MKTNGTPFEVFKGIAVVIVLVTLIAYLAPRDQSNHDRNVSQAHLMELPVGTPPPMTDRMRTELNKASDFQVLVSYTDRGFEPSDVTIDRHQTIRFTNNSSRPLWVAAVAANGRIYPTKESSCGQSDFDSCVALSPHEFWHYTFDEPGTWSYRNNEDRAQEGIVRVR